MTDNQHAAPFDTGPLSWVMAEIRDALGRSRTALQEAAGKSPDDQATSLQHAKTHLHQAHGALQMVDVEGVSLMTQAAEEALDRFKDGSLVLGPDQVQPVAQAYQAVVEYLEELMGGAAQHPARLFPYYRALKQLLGAERIHPADLFFADLSREVQLPPHAPTVNPDYTSYRKRFESALLPFLKAKAPADQARYAQELHGAIALVADAQSSAAARSFWYAMQTVAGMVAAGQLGLDVYVKQLFGQINLQMRRLSQGAGMLPEQMLRDALFFVAAAAAPSAEAQVLRRAFRLDGMVAPDYDVKRYGRIDADALKTAKDALAEAKTAWGRLASEADGSLEERFSASLAAFEQASARLNAPGLTQLLTELGRVARDSIKSGRSEEFGMEMAAAMLFIENSLDQIRQLPAEFTEQAEAVGARLLALAAGETPPDCADWQGDLSRQIQQGQTVQVLADEMKTGLRHVEKVLDDYYADSSRRAALQDIDPVLHQMQGALAILDQDDAMRAAQHVKQAVRNLASHLVPADAEPALLENIAQNVGALGFFIDTLGHSHESARERFEYDDEQQLFRSVPFGRSKQNVPEPEAPPAPVFEAPPAPPAPEPVAVPVPETPQGDAAVEAELLEIFIGEAQEVLELVTATIPAARSAPADQETLTRLRRSFHTLKGSGRMVGLNNFAEGAYGVEKVMNLWLSEVRAASPDLLALLDYAAADMTAWVQELVAKGHSARVSDVLVAAASRVQDGQPFTLAAPAQEAVAPLELQGETPMEAAAQTPAPAPVETPAEAPAEAPAETPFEMQLDTPVEAHVEAEANVPAEVHAEAPAEAGQVAGEPSAQDIDAADVIEAGLPADEPETIEAVAPEAEVILMPLPEPTPDEAPAPLSVSADIIDFPTVTPSEPEQADDNMRRIGDLEIALPLYNIYMAETDELLRVLERDFSEWRHEARRPVSPAALKAAHTLTGTSATVGYQAVREVAHTMEMTLKTLAPPAPELNAQQFDLLDTTLDVVKDMLQRFATGELAPAQPELVAQLEELGEQVRQQTVHSPYQDADPELAGKLDDLFNEAYARLLEAPPEDTMPALGEVPPVPAAVVTEIDNLFDTAFTDEPLDLPVLSEQAVPAALGLHVEAEAPVEAELHLEAQAPVEAEVQAGADAPVEAGLREDAEVPGDAELQVEAEVEAAAEAGLHVDVEAVAEAGLHSEAEAPAEAGLHSEAETPFEDELHSAAEVPAEVELHAEAPAPVDGELTVEADAPADTGLHIDMEMPAAAEPQVGALAQDTTQARSESDAPAEATLNVAAEAASWSDGEPAAPQVIMVPVPDTILAGTALEHEDVDAFTSGAVPAPQDEEHAAEFVLSASPAADAEELVEEIPAPAEPLDAVAHADSIDPVDLMSDEELEALTAPDPVPATVAEATPPLDLGDADAPVLLDELEAESLAPADDDQRAPLDAEPVAPLEAAIIPFPPVEPRAPVAASARADGPLLADAPLAQEEPALAGAPVHATGPQDELDADLLPIFLEEGADLLPQIGNALRTWQQNPADIAPANAMQRMLHTVKGSARMAGAMRLGQHTHDIETQIENMVHAGTSTPAAFDELMANYDQAMLMFEQLQAGGANPPPLPVEPVARPVAAPSGVPAGVPVNLGPISRFMPARAAEGATPAAADAQARTPLVRVRADILDRLVNQAGEVSITRSKLETQVGNVKQSLVDFADNLQRLRMQLREVEMQAESQIASRMSIAGEREFDPLEFDRFTRLQELTRMMAESVNDVASFQESLARAVDGATTDLSVQNRLTRELQQDLMRVRMVPFSSLSERLFRVARQAAKELDKRVNLDIRGGGVEIDRSVLEQMAAPFEHLLRNAIVHGIEPRAQRVAAGKGETGELLVQVSQQGNEVVLQFSDDGAGLNLERIRAKAREHGLLSADQEVSDAEAADLIFEPGFSTADSLTELAGRGVGMDVVRSEAAALGGRVATVTTAGQGTRFTIHLPLTLAVTQVVITRSAGKTYALPGLLVEQVLQIKEGPLALAHQNGRLDYQGASLALYFLPALLGDANARPLVQRSSPVIVLRHGSDRIAVHVDEIEGNREVVIKNIGQQLARMPGIAGATVLGSGEIVLILNPVALVHHMDHHPEVRSHVAPAPVVTHVAREIEVQRSRGNVVMVVDDSITVRKVTQRLLEREGYQVVLAKDGVDALEQMAEARPDLMLVDIEMPRMDGFDLTRNIRGNDSTHEIPIIMITSRTADKHRNYARDLGVNAYFGKPFQEDKLLAAIAGLLDKSAVPA